MGRARSIRYRCLGGEILYLVGGVEPARPPSRVDEEKTVYLGRDRVLEILSEDIPPIDRCIAAGRVPKLVLEALFSPSHVSNMVNAGRRIDAALHEELRKTRAPFRRLFALYGFPTWEQRRVLSEWQDEDMNRVGAESSGPRGRPMTARDTRRIEELIDQIGVEGVRKLLNDDDE